MSPLQQESFHYLIFYAIPGVTVAAIAAPPVRSFPDSRLKMTPPRPILSPCVSWPLAAVRALRIANRPQGRHRGRSKMAGFIASVDARTQLAGHNRMELLLFRLNSRQRFGINVFKVREVIQCPPLTQIPRAHHVVRGIVNIRGKTISVIDLGKAVGLPPIGESPGSFLIITEYNRHEQGFLVGSVDRIINQNWQEILPPPKGSGDTGYLTAVTKVEDELIGVLDVERVLAEVIGSDDLVSDSIVSESQLGEQPSTVLVVDDSVVARNQVKHTVQQIGAEYLLANNGQEALDLLSSMAADDPDAFSRLMLVISDIEMPQMDGYTLVTNIREREALSHLPVILHTSMSGNFNKVMVDKVGADEFIAKFEPDELADAARRWISKGTHNRAPPPGAAA